MRIHRRLSAALMAVLVAGSSPAAAAGDAADSVVVFGATDATAAAAPVLVGAGDIAGCGTDSDRATARLLDHIPGTVFTLGDNVYPSGSASQFRDCYDPTWGRHLARTRPAPATTTTRRPDAAPYFAYFGAAAGVPGQRLVQLRPRHLAHRRAELRLCGRGRM